MKVNITLLHTLVYTENKEKKLKMKVNIVILCYLRLTPPWSPSDCWVTGFASNPLSNFMLFDVSLTAISPMSYSSAQSLTDVQSFLSIFKCYLSLPHRCSSYPALSPYHTFAVWGFGFQKAHLFSTYAKSRPVGQANKAVASGHCILRKISATIFKNFPLA